MDNKYCCLFFLKWQTYFVHFFKVCLPNLNKHSFLSVGLSSKMMLHEKKGLIQLTTQLHLLFLKTAIVLGTQKRCFMHTSHFVTWNIKRCVRKNRDLRKLLILLLHQETFFDETDLFSFLLPVCEEYSDF